MASFYQAAYAADGRDVALRVSARPQVPASEVVTALALSINGVASGATVAVRDIGGDMALLAQDLRAGRVLVAAEAGDDTWVKLKDLPAVKVSLNVAAQMLELTIAPRGMSTVHLGPDASTQSDVGAIRPITAFLVDYSLYAASGTAASPALLNGFIGGRLMTPHGTFVSTYNAYASNSRAGSGVVPLETYWRVVDPVAVRSYTVGDFVSGALGWTNAYRLSGFQVQSAFQQRSDIVTAALPTIGGSVAVPSSLDVYVNNQQIYAGSVAAGPFALNSTPTASGSSVRVVTRDALGRETTVTGRYYYSPSILRRGVFDYSLQAGFIRRDYAAQAFSYEKDFAAIASTRYGISNTLTVEGHAEAMGSLLQGGVGLNREVAGIGAISVAAAGSHMGDRSGLRLSAQWDMQIDSLTFYAGTVRSTNGYTDIARAVVLERGAPGKSGFYDKSAFDLSAYAKRIDRAGVSYELPIARATSLGLAYYAIGGDVNAFKSLNMSASTTLSSRVGVFASGYRQFARAGTTYIQIGLSIAFRHGVSASANATRQDGHDALELRAAGSTSQRQGQIAWSLYDREEQGDRGLRQAFVSTRSSFADLQGGVEQSGSNVRATGQIGGTLLFFGDGVRAVDRIGDAFAVVRNAGPGVEVQQNSASMATSDAHGFALLPDLLPYRSTTISIDPVKLPLGWSVPATERQAIAGYQNGVVVDFGAHRSRSAIVTMVDTDGNPLPAGFVAVREDGSQAVIGYSGETYLEDMQPVEHLVVDRGAPGKCRATVIYPHSASLQVRVGNVRCIDQASTRQVLAQNGG